MLQEACLPSCHLPSIIILKASRKWSEEALSALASVLRRDQTCVFHHKYAVSPYKGSYESIYTFTSIPSPPCLAALRAGRCHIFRFPPVLTSFHS